MSLEETKKLPLKGKIYCLINIPILWVLKNQEKNPEEKFYVGSFNETLTYGCIYFVQYLFCKQIKDFRT